MKAGKLAYARSAQERLEEAVGLAEAIGLVVDQTHLIALQSISPSHYIGKGKVNDIAEAISERALDVIIFNGALSPIQQRNLERALKVKVIDRTALILEIFGERAKTREGALQVELAHLKYQQGRLVRSWTHLERQRGGVGFMGGPGETQIETDRRLLRQSILSIEKRLEEVRRTRALARRKRKRAPYPVVVLVGYTNAGKSTLFNRLTEATVLSKDMLFATLDPTVRRVTLPGGLDIMLSDTVGFISDLPTELVAAFRATLEEVVEADVLLHVQDVSAPDYEEQRSDVLAVLSNLGVNEQAGEGPPIVEVLNKSDLADDDTVEALNNKARRQDDMVLISAITGAGLDSLEKAISRAVPRTLERMTWFIPHDAGAALSAAYRLGENVELSQSSDAGSTLEGEFDTMAIARMRSLGAEIAQ